MPVCLDLGALGWARSDTWLSRAWPAAPLAGWSSACSWARSGLGALRLGPFLGVEALGRFPGWVAELLVPSAPYSSGVWLSHAHVQHMLLMDCMVHPRISFYRPNTGPKLLPQGSPEA